MNVFYIYSSDHGHLGNIRQVIHPSSWYEQPQINNYYPYGGLMANSSNQDLQRYKYNGKELDRMHGLDWYDYGARWMDGVIGRWHSMDPLCEKYYSVSPYAYCANNPVKNIDIDGLYPKDILKFHAKSFPRSDYYTLSKPAAFLLSLVSGVDVHSIEKVNILERGIGKFYPWYNADEGGGAITMGSGKDNATITLTNNFFEDNKSEYNNHGYGQDIDSWLDLLSHEVIHLNHIEVQINKITYGLGFIWDYCKYGSHDAVPREKEADNGTDTYRDFKSFVNKEYGKNSLINLFKSNKNANEQIRQIIIWWQQYQNSKSNN